MNESQRIEELETQLKEEKVKNTLLNIEIEKLICYIKREKLERNNQ